MSPFLDNTDKKKNEFRQICIKKKKKAILLRPERFIHSQTEVQYSLEPQTDDGHHACDDNDQDHGDWKLAACICPALPFGTAVSQGK